MPRPKPEVGKKRTTIYLPDALIWKMREIRIHLRITSDTQAIEVALAEWVSRNDGSAKSSTVPPPARTSRAN